MAQKILIRRGPIANLAGAASSQGELLLATGVIGDLTGPFLTMTGTSGTGTSTIIGKIYEGASTPSIASNSPLTGLPYYNTTDNALIRLNHAGNQTLDLTGNLEGNAVTSMTIGQLVGNVSIVSDGALQDGDLSVAGLLTVTGDISGSNLNLTGNATIDGNIVLGGNINIGNADTDTITLGGEITSNIVPDVDSTYSLGTTSKRWVNIYADGLIGDTINLSAGATIGGGLEVGGQTTFKNNVYLGDSANPGNSVLRATEGMLLISSAVNRVLISSDTSDVQIEGTIFDGNDVTIAGALEVTGATDLNSTLNVSGDITLDGAGSQNITQTGTGDLNISSTNGSVFINGTEIDNTGDVTFPGAINTPGASFGDNIDIPGYIQLEGDLTFDGASHQNITNTSGNLAISSTNGNVLVEGSTFNGNDVTVPGNIDLGGTANFAGNVTLDGSGAQSITQTGTGDLTISSTNGNVYVEGTLFNGNDLTVAGNLTVSGTTTTIDSTTVQIGDNIIELNAAGTAADGGIVVQDAVGASTASGSLLWNATNDYWYAGFDGATHYRLATFENGSPADNAVPRINSDKRLVAGSISDTGAAVTISNAATINGISDSSSTAAIRFSYINASKALSYITPTTSGDILQWNGTAMVASNVIDGGTF